LRLDGAHLREHAVYNNRERGGHNANDKQHHKASGSGARDFAGHEPVDQRAENDSQQDCDQQRGDHSRR